jgi:hypothetical protein
LGAVVVPVHGGGGLVRLLLLVGLGVERGGDERIVLGAEVLLSPPKRGVSVAFSGLRRGELVLAFEGGEVADAHLELVRDPRIGAALTDPGSDLVQLGLQGPAGHGRGRLPTRPGP